MAMQVVNANVSLDKMAMSICTCQAVNSKVSLDKIPMPRCPQTKCLCQDVLEHNANAKISLDKMSMPIYPWTICQYILGQNVNTKMGMLRYPWTKCQCQNANTKVSMDKLLSMPMPIYSWTKCQYQDANTKMSLDKLRADVMSLHRSPQRHNIEFESRSCETKKLASNSQLETLLSF